jgi:hypothetical protein
LNQSEAKNAANHTVGIAAIVSEQVLPILSFVLHLVGRHRSQLQFVGLYHTDDAKRSRDPARRIKVALAAFAAQEGLALEIELCEDGARAIDVRHAMKKWFDERGDIQRWIVNVTGGMKPMAMGLGSFLSGAATVNEVRKTLAYKDICDVSAEERTALLSPKPGSDDANDEAKKSEDSALDKASRFLAR